MVMPGDLNAANRLFGGRIMQWADEAAVMYAMCQLSSRQLVTVKVSEVLFKEPVMQGDILEFMTNTLRVGKTSLGVKLDVYRKSIEDKMQGQSLVFTCEFTFVQVDDTGSPTEHILHKGKKE